MALRVEQVRLESYATKPTIFTVSDAKSKENVEDDDDDSGDDNSKTRNRESKTNPVMGMSLKLLQPISRIEIQ